MLASSCLFFRCKPGKDTSHYYQQCVYLQGFWSFPGLYGVTKMPSYFFPKNSVRKAGLKGENFLQPTFYRVNSRTDFQLLLLKTSSRSIQSLLLGQSSRLVSKCQQHTAVCLPVPALLAILPSSRACSNADLEIICNQCLSSITNRHGVRLSFQPTPCSIQSTCCTEKLCVSLIP